MPQRSADRPLGDLPLARGTVWRDPDLRSQPDLVERLLHEPSTRVLDLHAAGLVAARAEPGAGPAVGDGAGDPGAGLVLALRPPAETDRERGRLVVYLGRDGDGTAYLGVVSEQPREAGTLREVGAALDDRDAGLLTTLQALANWHAAHPHCARCGARTEPALAGWVRRCPADGSEHYPRTDPAVIVAVTDAADRLLLARGPSWPQRSYSVLAGFVEPGEPLEAAVVREVREEVGIGVGEVRYLGNQPWPFPCSLMLAFAARAQSTSLRFADGEIEDAVWLGREDLAERVADGSLRLPGRVSIARAMVEHWYGDRLAPAVEQVSARG